MKLVEIIPSLDFSSPFTITVILFVPFLILLAGMVIFAIPFSSVISVPTISSTRIISTGWVVTGLPSSSYVALAITVI